MVVHVGRAAGDQRDGGMDEQAQPVEQQQIAAAGGGAGRSITGRSDSRHDPAPSGESAYSVYASSSPHTSVRALPRSVSSACQSASVIGSYGSSSIRKRPPVS